MSGCRRSPTYSGLVQTTCNIFCTHVYILNLDLNYNSIYISFSINIQIKVIYFNFSFICYPKPRKRFLNTHLIETLLIDRDRWSTSTGAIERCMKTGEFGSLARHSWGTVGTHLGHKIENSRAQLRHNWGIDGDSSKYNFPVRDFLLFDILFLVDSKWYAVVCDK